MKMNMWKELRLQIRNLKTWLWAVSIWLINLKRFWLCVGVLLLVFITSVAAGGTSKHFVYAGYVLEILGIWLAFQNLIELTDHFKIKTPFTKAIQSFPGWPKAVKGSVNITLQGDSVSARGTVSSPALGVNPTVKEQLKRLHEDVEELRQNMAIIRAEAKQFQRIANENLHSAKVSIENKLTESTAQLEKAQTKGIELSLVGIVWLALGLTFNTLSDEVACLISFIFSA